MIKRLRLKFICINMAIVTIMLCAIFLTVLRFVRTNLERESIRMMQTVATEPVRAGPPDKPPSGVHLPYFILQVGQNGELIVSGGEYYDLSDKEFLYALIEQTASSQERVGLLPSYNLRFCKVVTPEVQCIVFADVSSEINAMHHLYKGCLAVGGVSFLLFLFLSFLLARWAVRPVDQAWKQQRQFVSDASHELKTPLTVILTNAEMLQTTQADAADRAQFLENILIMSRQMRELIENLLDLARVDNGIPMQERTHVDLSALVSRVVLPFEPVYFEQGLEIVTQVETGIVVRGSEAHLNQMVSVFLDNAQKYALSPGAVTVKLKKCLGRHCLLSVSNPGAPISPEDLQNIFKRFYRADKARGRDGSYGLGLSIAERIVREHGGKIWAESAHGMNTFYVQFPTQFGKNGAH